MCGGERRRNCVDSCPWGARRGALFPGRPTHQLLCPPAVQSSRLSRHVPETGGGGGAWAGRAGSRESVPARPVSRRETDVTGPRAAARHAPAMRRAYHGRRLRPSHLSAPRLPEARSTQCAQHDSRLSPEHRRDRSCGLPHTGCNSPEALPRAETDRTSRGVRVLESECHVSGGVVHCASTPAACPSASWADTRRRASSTALM